MEFAFLNVSWSSSFLKVAHLVYLAIKTKLDRIPQLIPTLSWNLHIPIVIGCCLHNFPILLGISFTCFQAFKSLIILRLSCFIFKFGFVFSLACLGA